MSEVKNQNKEYCFVLFFFVAVVAVGYLVIFCLELTPLKKTILGTGGRSTQFWIGEREERRVTHARGAEG